MAASPTGVVGVPSDVDVTCVLSFTSAFPTQRRWVMIKTKTSIWVEKTTQRFLECRAQRSGGPAITGHREHLYITLK